LQVEIQEFESEYDFTHRKSEELAQVTKQLNQMRECFLNFQDNSKSIFSSFGVVESRSIMRDKDDAEYACITKSKRKLDSDEMSVGSHE
jgi:hypothetical protein